MNEIDIIKEQIKRMKDLKDSSNQNIQEHISEIKKKYLINEEDSVRSLKRYDVPSSVEGEIEDDEEDLDNEKSQSYRISGGILTIHGDDSTDINLTTEDKKIFQETMDEFVSEVSDLVNFNKLNVYKNNVDWSGTVVDFDTEFYFTIGESNGIYISNDMSQVDENYINFLNNLQKFYEKFKSKWAKLLAERKKTDSNKS